MIAIIGLTLSTPALAQTPGCAGEALLVCPSPMAPSGPAGDEAGTSAAPGAAPALTDSARRPPAASRAQAGSGTESTYDRIWRFADWYEDESAAVVQRVLFSGCFQYDYAWIDADQGSLSEWNLRRLRLGPRITMFRQVLFHAEIELDPQENDPTYVRFTDFYVQWTRSPQLAITVGKQGVPFTVDGATSSKDLITIDRSNLSNNIWFPQEYMPGLSVSGRASPWVYRVGVYSAGDANREFGDFSGSVFGLGVLGYDFARSAGMKEAVVTANYVYQDPDPDNTFTRELEHVASLNLRLEDERWGVRTDISLAAGYPGRPDLWGVMAMPFLNLTEKLQVVGRYTRLTSGDVNGVRLATYESRVVSGRGDRYDELYAGVNYYFYGHKLKLQSGVQFAEMDDRAADGGDYSGTSWTTGLRIGW